MSSDNISMESYSSSYCMVDILNTFKFELFFKIFTGNCSSLVLILRKSHYGEHLKLNPSFPPIGVKCIYPGGGVPQHVLRGSLMSHFYLFHDIRKTNRPATSKGSRTRVTSICHHSTLGFHANRGYTK